MTQLTTKPMLRCILKHCLIAWPPLLLPLFVVTFFSSDFAKYLTNCFPKTHTSGRMIVCPEGFLIVPNTHSHCGNRGQAMIPTSTGVTQDAQGPFREQGLAFPEQEHKVHGSKDREAQAACRTSVKIWRKPWKPQSLRFHSSVCDTKMNRREMTQAFNIGCYYFERRRKGNRKVLAVAIANMIDGPATYI